MAAPRATFLVVGGLFGLFFALATPPHDPPDEARHHARAWLISGGRLGVVGAAPGHEASIPRDIVRLHRPGHHYTEEQLRSGLLPSNAPRTGPHEFAKLRSELRGSLARWDLQAVRFTSSYLPLVYLPYVPALWLASALEGSAAAGLLLARLFGLAAWLAGIVMILGIAPAGRGLLVAVALLPMSVSQAAAVSGDPLTQLAIFWWFAECLRSAARGGGGLTRADVARMLVAALALGLVKPGYAPLALAALGLPLRAGPRLALTGAALAAAALPTLWWSGVVGAAQPLLYPGADASRQLRHVLAHPLDFLAAAGGTVAALYGAWLEGMVGNLGHFDVEIPPAATALGLAAVAASVSLGRSVLGAPARLAFGASFAAASLAVLAMGYLGWTPVGADKILGVQGRYFLPMLPFALVLVLGISAYAMVRTYYAL